MATKEQKRESASRRRKIERAGKRAGEKAAETLIERWAAKYDEDAGIGMRNLKADSTPAILARIFDETGVKPSAKVQALTDENAILLTDTVPRAAGYVKQAKDAVATIQKQEAIEDAKIIRPAAVGNVPADLGDSALEAARNHLLECNRYQAGTTVALKASAAEVAVALSQRPFENWLARVWAEFVAIPAPTDSTTIGEAKAGQARAAVVFEELFTLYQRATYPQTDNRTRKGLRRLWDEALAAGGPMPKIGDAEEKLNATRAAAVADETAALAAHEEKRAAEKAQAIEDAGHGARGRTQKVTREDV